ncbi:hypothetical protein XELAEV_18034664mg [Xenopus laevis]|uniref:Uncharacterized protein n=1 Tax=Xenopus laevis TaxID=8355 RepID=A0A974CEA4_XENLA|nr:hypothetical protein XELAEV_18034664mg [Xenopus laevis]
MASLLPTTTNNYLILLTLSTQMPQFHQCVRFLYGHFNKVGVARKATQAPLIREWKQLVNSNLPHIKAVYVSRNFPNKFESLWAKWLALDELITN